MGTITRSIANNVLSNGTIDATDGLTGTIPASNVNNASISNLTAFPATVGDFVEATASDVAASPSTKGQLFYNTTTGRLKGIGNLGGTFSSGGNTNTAREYQGGSVGTQTAAVIFAQNADASSEEYDGSTWTAGNPVNLARYSGGSGGTQTAAFFAGGSVPAGSDGPGATENYDGTSWTTTNPLNTARKYLAGCGSQTAGLVGGGGYPTPKRAATEEYDGSSWTSGGNLNNGNYNVRITSSGTQTATICAGGNSRGTNTESYNGTSWTNVNAMNTARASAACTGNQTLGLIFGGYGPAGPATGSAENWDGTSWTSNPATMANARQGFYGVGTSTSAMAATGNNPSSPGATNFTEEYTDPTIGIVTLTTS